MLQFLYLRVRTLLAARLLLRSWVQHAGVSTALDMTLDSQRQSSAAWVLVEVEAVVSVGTEQYLEVHQILELPCLIILLLVHRLYLLDML